MNVLPYIVQSAPEGVNSTGVDGIIFVSSLSPGKAGPSPVRQAVENAAQYDDGFSSRTQILPLAVPARRLVFSPVKPLGDYDDVRSYAEAAHKAVSRALKAGVRAPLVLLPGEAVENVDLVVLLAVLEALYVPIQIREDAPERQNKVKNVLVCRDNNSDVEELIRMAVTLEAGRHVARDIGGGDPERMAAPAVEQYVRQLLDKQGSSVQITTVSDEQVLAKEYPLFAAVNRAASLIERHKGRILYLRYEPEGPVTETLFLVGKGITYDTGGADLKVGGAMAGMSRDKCGAAAVAGMFQVVSLLKPKGIRVVGAMCLARNSIGENSYVSDEVITARSKARVRVSNTDAEGRMVMADVLCKIKEEALKVQNAHIVTLATLTGHAVYSVGPYSIAMDNSVARRNQNAERLQESGMRLADPVEVSKIRREDFEAHKGHSEWDDLHQTNSGKPSSRSKRGHQAPAAFLIGASGLDKHDLSSASPLSYTHIDIAGSAGDLPKEPTGAPILALVDRHLLSLGKL